MGRGLSSLQTAILAVLDQWPSFEQASAVTPRQFDYWAFPCEIIEGLGLPKNPSTRVSVSRALVRLCERGHVARVSDDVVHIGRSYRYLKINDVAQARALPQPRRTWVAITGKRPAASGQCYEKRGGTPPVDRSLRKAVSRSGSAEPQDHTRQAAPAHRRTTSKSF
jgi:hypothetical protein